MDDQMALVNHVKGLVIPHLAILADKTCLDCI
jgi:hypothetical protein